MPKVLRVLAIVAGVLVGVVVIAVIAVFAISGSNLNRTFEVTGDDLDIASVTDMEEAERLYISRGCAGCHGADGAGGILADDPAIGRIVSTNLTTLDYTPAEYELAIRHGLHPDGTPMLIMPSEDWITYSDEEIAHIIAYMETFEPVENDLTAQQIGPLGRFLIATDPGSLLPAYTIDHSLEAPATVEAEVSVVYGEYIGQLCMGCHGDNLAGGPVPGEGPDAPPASNLTPSESGIAAYTEEDLFASLREGIRPDGSALDPAYMPWPSFSQLNDTEISALWAYLQSIDAVENEY
ncbi:MAG: c-type cytochrome [Chloroflexi bacterium]|nr:c-type cytochrome [Chloroflexota bacterium]